MVIFYHYLIGEKPLGQGNVDAPSVGLFKLRYELKIWG